MEVDNYDDFETDEIDYGVCLHHTYKWIMIEKLDNYNLKPQNLIDLIKNNNYEQIFHIIQKD